MRIYVEGRKLRITEHDILVSGSVGVNFAYFGFAEDWAGKAVMAVFEANESVSREVVVPPEGAVEIPWEVLPEPGVLRIGVYALGEGLMMPTVWSMPQTIYQGAEPADPPAEHESTPWQDAVSYMGATLNETKAARDDALSSRQAAKESEENAFSSQQAAKESEENAFSSQEAAEAAHAGADAAMAGAEAAKEKAEAAQTKAETAWQNAQNWAEEAHAHKTAAETAANESLQAAAEAKQSETYARVDAQTAQAGAVSATEAKEAAVDAQTKAEAAWHDLQALDTEAATLEPGEHATAEYEKATNKLLFGIPKGMKGDRGFSPTMSISKNGKTTTVTVTDLEGTKTFEILDGQDGEGAGDMLASLYDPDGDYAVEKADYAEQAGHADEADHATSATSAISATTSTTAVHATTAGNATTADKATNADSATNAGHADEADHATTADSATNAGHADEADHATTADSATNAGHATSATSATTATTAAHATTAGHATTADSATNATNATNATSAATAANAEKLGGAAPSAYRKTADQIDYQTEIKNKPTIKTSTGVTITVAASAWTGEEAPYTATVACSIATASNILHVGVAGNASTAEQREAIRNAMIMATGQSAGSITLTADGEKPEMDISINVVEVI